MNFRLKLRKHYINITYALSRLFSHPFIKPSFMQINITCRCNLHCGICTTFQYPSNPDQELTAGEIKDLVLQGFKMGIKTIVFSGGEPFLREDLFEILKFTKENTAMKVNITTNGTLIDKAMAEKIVSLGVDHLQISLDGAFRKTHDYIRGEGAFEKTIQAIKIFNQIKNGTPVLGASFTITTSNFREMPDFLNLCRELNIDEVLFIPFIEDNTYIHKNYSLHEFFLKRNMLPAFDLTLNEVYNFKSKHGRPFISNFENLVLYKKYFSGQLNERHWWCFAGFHWIQVNPLGDMRMCEWNYGNIRGDKKLNKIWRCKEAFKARIKIKKCKRLCLQPCMSKPE